jgi:four helix bundle protein
MAIYRSLIAWQKAIDLACDIYTIAERFPNRERFVLAQQICDAAISVPSNIAEGRGRGTRKDFCHFLYYARGSVYELETHLTMARRLRYVTEQEEADLLERSARVLRLINGLIRRLSSPDLRPPTHDHP